MTKVRTRRRPAVEKDLPAAASFLRYIESSALVAALLEQDAEVLQAFREIGHRVTSALTFAEANRAVVRARIAGRLSDRDERSALRDLRAFEQHCTVFAVTEAVLARAGHLFPIEPVRTLDAIHLATIELLGETPQLVTVVTRDDRVARNARSLGYDVVP